MSQRNLSTIKRGLAYTLAIVLVPLLSGVVGMGARMVSSVRTGTTPPPFTGALPTPPAHDPRKRTAVVIAANSGTEGSDFLAPYAVLGSIRRVQPLRRRARAPHHPPLPRWHARAGRRFRAALLVCRV